MAKPTATPATSWPTIPLLLLILTTVMTKRYSPAEKIDSGIAYWCWRPLHALPLAALTDMDQYLPSEWETRYKIMDQDFSALSKAIQRDHPLRYPRCRRYEEMYWRYVRDRLAGPDVVMTTAPPDQGPPEKTNVPTAILEEARDIDQVLWGMCGMSLNPNYTRLATMLQEPTKDWAGRFPLLQPSLSWVTTPDFLMKVSNDPNRMRDCRDQEHKYWDFLNERLREMEVTAPIPELVWDETTTAIPPWTTTPPPAWTVENETTTLPKTGPSTGGTTRRTAPTTTTSTRTPPPTRSTTLLRKKKLQVLQKVLGDRLPSFNPDSDLPTFTLVYWDEDEAVTTASVQVEATTKKKAHREVDWNVIKQLVIYGSAAVLLAPAVLLLYCGYYRLKDRLYRRWNAYVVRRRPPTSRQPRQSTPEEVPLRSLSQLDLPDPLPPTPAPLTRPSPILFPHLHSFQPLPATAQPTRSPLLPRLRPMPKITPLCLTNPEAEDKAAPLPFGHGKLLDKQ